jgi:hypothetical protein
MRSKAELSTFPTTLTTAVTTFSAHVPRERHANIDRRASDGHD